MVSKSTMISISLSFHMVVLHSVYLLVFLVSSYSTMMSISLSFHMVVARAKGKKVNTDINSISNDQQTPRFVMS